MKILGIDIGATDISGAPVDTDDGSLLTEPVEIDTPDPATPDAIAGVVAEITRRFDWHGPIGVAFPAVIKDCVVQTAVNVDESWVGIDAAALFEGATGQPVAVLNDADAAGLAEVVFGAGRGRDGKVIVVTIGTGLGVAVFEDGVLVPNVEFPDIEVRGEKADKQASGSALKELELEWEAFGERLGEYLRQVQERTRAVLFILGGGVSEEHDNFLPHLRVEAEVVPAEMRNQAGIVGAALAARGVRAGE